MKKLFFIIIFIGACVITNAQSDNVIGFRRKSGGLPYNPLLKPFYHGVASGDPLPDGVIIWTRVTPDAPNETITVEWQMATDTGIAAVVKSGTITTDSTKDFTVKVDVSGLSPATTYYYVFKAKGIYSTIGRARTAPMGNASHLRFGVVSCNNYEAGFFNSFNSLSVRNDIDAVIHLGDYIYEYAAKQYGDSTTSRFVQPENEAVTEADYRTRYSMYRLDADLQRAHQQHTFISIWDDHESANDSYKDGAQNHQTGEGDWQTRRAISRKVYFEWMPIRNDVDNKVYRTIKYGDMADLILLDARLEGRTKPPANFDDPDIPQRAMLGTAQYQWFINELKTSSAKWKVVGNQVLFSDLNVGFSARNSQGFPSPSDINAIREVERVFINTWESYPTERDAIIDTIEQGGIKNVVILTGDSHMSWAFDVTKQPAIYPNPQANNYASPSPTYIASTGQGSVAVEFCVPSISSANMDERVGVPVAAQFEQWVSNPISFLNNSHYNPHLKYADVDRHGYFILDLKDDTAQAGYYYADKINTPTTVENFGKTALTVTNTGRVQVSANAPLPKTKQEIPAPAKLPLPVAVQGVENAVVFYAYPNPASNTFTLQYGVIKNGVVKITVYTVDGKAVSHWQQQQGAGLYNFTLSVTGLAEGLYTYVIESDGEVATGKFLVR